MLVLGLEEGHECGKLSEANEELDLLHKFEFAAAEEDKDAVAEHLKKRAAPAGEAKKGKHAAEAAKAKKAAEMENAEAEAVSIFT